MANSDKRPHDPTWHDVEHLLQQIIRLSVFQKWSNGRLNQMFVGYLFCNLSSLFYCAIAAVLSLSLSDASAVHAALMVSRCANNVNKSRPIQPMQRCAIVYKTNIRLLQR